ncbi:MAG: hypothetical protein A2Z32_09240 [Chloroflexi bacterium RBG_16_69_14]|nr:MAG: hypothetical protein A2Z32_09240 [Chloroflexi bacterium RBG_16_69_14]
MCTACGASVPTGRIRILARRDDLAFVELDCPDCGSEALGLLMASATDGEPILDVATDAPAMSPSAGASTLRPISEADVEAVRRDLATWDGDLVGWLDTLDGGDRRGSVVER